MSATLRIPSSSTEYVYALVDWRRGVNADTVLTFGVKAAFKSDGTEPVSSDYVAGVWEKIGARPYAKVLVGPSGTVTLAEGTYEMWLEITAGVEVVVRKVAGKVVVT